MENKIKAIKALTFVMMAFAVIYAFDSLNNGALSANSVTGMVISEPKLNQQDVSCYDSDSRDYYVQGTTYSRLFEVNSEPPKEDVCQDDTLIEYYCVYNEPQVEFYDCPGGCMNGACIQLQ